MDVNLPLILHGEVLNICLYSKKNIFLLLLLIGKRNDTSMIYDTNLEKFGFKFNNLTTISAIEISKIRERNGLISFTNYMDSQKFRNKT